MANKLITPNIIAKEALMQLENNLVFAGLVHREYKKEFVKIGDSVSIRKPVKFYAADGATLQKQDVEEGNVSVNIGYRKHVGWEFTTRDLTLTVEEYSERYIKPACITIAQVVDSAVASQYYKFWNFVGTPGTTPSTFQHLALASQRLDEMAVPSSPRSAVLNPAAGWSLAGSQAALYMQDVAKGAYREGRLGPIAGLDTYHSQNIQYHTVGTKAGTPLVNGGTQNVTYQSLTNGNRQSLVTDGWTASSAVLKKGDVITIAGVYAVNPVPGQGTTGKQVMPYLQQFTVLEDVTADGSGNATLTISPAIITSGAQQTVSAAPADNAAITVVTGTASTAYPQNLVFARNAIALVTVPLQMPDGAAFKAQESHKGLSIRVVKDYDIENDVEIIRLDVMFGVEVIYPDLGVRLTG